MGYLLQQDEHSCGPVAIVNFLIDIGMEVTSDTLTEVSDEVGTLIFSGTSLLRMVGKLCDHAYVKIIENPTEILSDNFILLYCPTKKCFRSHYVYVRRLGYKWRVTNFEDASGNYSHKLMTDKQLIKLFTKTGKDDIMVNMIDIKLL